MSEKTKKHFHWVLHQLAQAEGADPLVPTYPASGLTDNDIPSLEGGVTDWDVIKVMTATLLMATPVGRRHLAQLWNPEVRAPARGSTAERQAYYWISRARARWGFPRIRTYRVRLAIGRCLDHLPKDRGVLVVPRRAINLGPHDTGSLDL